MSFPPSSVGATPVAQARRFSIALFLVSLVFGLNLAFFPVWLDARGLSADQIGLVLAMPLAALVLFVPPLCAYADRRGRIAATFVASAVAVAASYLALALAPNMAMLVLAAAAMALARAPLLALGDALTFALMALDQRIDYGRVRIWCSAAVLIAMAAGGLVVERIAPDAIIWLLVAVTCVGAIAAMALTPRSIDRPRGAAAAPQTGRITRPLVLITVIVAASLVQASHAIIYAFGSLHWREQGASGGFIGLVWAIGVASEMALFAVAGRWGVERRAASFLTLGAAASAARWMLMGLDPSGLALLALTLAHAATFGATHLGSMYLLARLTPPHARAQAQGWLSSATGLSLMALTAASGPIYRAFGERAYWGMAAIALIALALAVIVERRLAQPQSADSGGNTVEPS